jgi:predicted permease
MEALVLFLGWWIMFAILMGWFIVMCISYIIVGRLSPPKDKVARAFGWVTFLSFAGVCAWIYLK